MRSSAPIHRRKFANAWDEIGYLYDKLLYWLYCRHDTTKARLYAVRLELLLRKASPDHQAILGEECWSLIYEARGDLRAAILHRENEIRLIRQLHDMVRELPETKWLLKEYSYSDLSDRLDLLATLYHEKGDLDKATETLEESKRLCGAHGIKFDGRALLKEYRNENRTSPELRMPA